MTSSGRDLFRLMAGSVAVAAGADAGGVRATATASVSSYSIDPPSVLLSLPTGLANALPPRFGLSLLAQDQQELAEVLWESVATIDNAIVHDGAPLVPHALAHLVCEPTLVECLLGRLLVVATVVTVSVNSARPLVWMNNRLRGGAA